MKNHAKLILAVALASSFSLASQIRADDIARSPKGESQRPTSVTVDTKGEPDLVHGQPFTGNARAQVHHPIMVAGGANDQIASERPVYTGRNPFRELPRFEVAPLAKPGKDCTADCQKPCCTKK